MIFLFQSIFILFSLMLLCVQEVEANSKKEIKENPSIYLNDKIWEKVQGYLIPDDHPAKESLDQIFSSSRALADKESMIAAGFDSANPQKCTKIIVTKHSDLPGYVIKAYLDSTSYGTKGRPDHDFLIKRIIGARLIENSIKTHHYEHLFKVPKKWLYLLPDEPSPPSNYLRRIFILVEEDMDLVSDKKNVKLWRSEKVTEELLEAFYTVVTEVRLSDSTQLSNCPFSKDGRIAFIDTQMFNAKLIKYQKLTPYLSPNMRTYWEKLIKR